MKELPKHNSGVSEYELFSFLSERILSGEISSFSALKDLSAPVLGNKRSHPVLLRAFELLKRLYWGFFASISPQTHHKLWGQLVITDKDFPDAGDLKRTLQISDIYVAMLDIHGYTRFCMESRKNLSMLHTLDQIIVNEIRGICTACGAVSQRERGDEIVVVATSASDILSATIGIIDYFGKTGFLNDPRIFTKRAGDAEALPVFKLSAGITGGNTTIPLIVTEKGNLSGFLLNSGARLQMLANRLSSSESKVMASKQVQMNFKKENDLNPCSLAENKAVYFFDTGQIEFKGVMIPTCEVVYNSNEMYKEQFSAELVRLFGSIKDNLWEQRIFVDTVGLFAKVTQVMPKFTVNASLPGEVLPVSNDTPANLAKKAIKAYVEDEDYVLALLYLRKFIEIARMIPSFDQLVMDYMEGVYARYELLLESYKKNIDRQIEENEKIIFQGNYYQAWTAAKKSVSVYEKFLEAGRNSTLITRKKNIWYGLIKEKSSEMVFTFHSGKK